MCVQSSSVLRVLQFTPFNVVCYVLHRSVSQVIHGQQLSFLQTIASVKSMAVSEIEEASRLDNLSIPAIPSLIKRAIAHYKHWQADLPTKPEVESNPTTP
jgi:hypothetical protein